jgi:hypothetical protein
MPRSAAQACTASARPTHPSRTGGLTATGGGHRASICRGDPRTNHTRRSARASRSRSCSSRNHATARARSAVHDRRGKQVIHLPPNSIRRASSPPRMSRRRPVLSSGAAATRDPQPAAPDRARLQRAGLLRRPGGAPAETAQRAHQRRRDGGLGSGGRQWRGRSTLASRCACACCRCWCARCPLPRVLDRGRCCVDGGGENWLVPSARHHARNPPRAGAISWASQWSRARGAWCCAL